MRFQVERISGLQLRYYRFDDIDIVEMFEFIVEEKHTKSNFIDGIGQLVTLIGRVDVDQNEIGHGCGQLNGYPFVFVVGVDSDSIFGLQLELVDQSCGQLLG